MEDLFVNSNGIRLAVRDYGGEGRPLVLVHGGPGPNLISWDSFAHRMAGRFRPIAYDQRGHGQSDDAADYSYHALTGDILAIVDTLHLEDPIVAGHSWGGMIALMYAAEHPDGCAGVVAVDGAITGWRGRSEQELEWLEKELRTDPLASRTLGFVGTAKELDELVECARVAASSSHEQFSEEAFRRNVVAGPDGLLRVRHTADTFLALNREVAEQAMPSIEIYDRITCPVMLVMATKGMFGREVVERLGELYPKLRIEWVESHHEVQNERPEELAALITGFASSVPSR